MVKKILLNRRGTENTERKEEILRVTLKGLVFKYRDGFVILEDVTIGVCDTCGNRYYSSDIFHAVHAVATGAKPPERTEQIPVTHLESV